MTEVKPFQIDAGGEKIFASDFAELRQHGIDLLQELTGTNWTDYNLHDPGVTILELLCFAITDLSYRTEFPLWDTLALSGEKDPGTDNAFFPAAQILTTNPVTVNDFRKIILDGTEEISNVWIDPVFSAYGSGAIKGLFRIYLQVNEETAKRIATDKELAESIKDRVKVCFVSMRNCCEDALREIVLMQPVRVGVKADVEIHERFVPEEVLAAIYDKLSAHFNAPVRIYSEKEMRQQGFSDLDLYSGPLLGKGFIPDSELVPPIRQVNPMDLVEIVNSVEGVLLVKKLEVTAGGKTSDKAPISLDPYSFPLFDAKPESSYITFYKNKYVISIRQAVLNDVMPKFSQRKMRQNYAGAMMTLTGPVQAALAKEETADPPISDLRAKTITAIEKYYSIQDHFPLIYGIGREGLPEQDRARHGKARQLKGYLLFFEQIMANYLSQLANIRGVFSIYPDRKDPRTYYYQPLFEIPGVGALLKNGYTHTLSQAVETADTYRARKNAVLDHLLARFNIVLDEFPLTLYTQMYEDAQHDKKADTLLKWKAGILQQVVELSHDRTKAFDYTKPLKGPGLVTGFEKRILSLLYIPTWERRSLTASFDGKKIFMAPSRPAKGSGVSLSGDEPAKESEGGEREKDTLEDGFMLKNQTIGLFRFGIDQANYKIEAPGDGRNFLVSYKEPDSTQWIVVAQRPDRSSAQKALKELTDTLKRVSLDSEGCHIIEHVLLRPTITGNSFGFGLYQLEKYRVAQHKDWTSYEGRENAIRALIGLTAKGGDTDKSVLDQLPDLCHVEKGAAQVLRTLSTLSAKERQRFYPKFEMFTRRFGFSMIKEDFFNFRMTVALPAWPARFQNKNFRMFTEDLFRTHGPAHLRIKFSWMGISDMQQFEKVYFDWRDLFISRKGNLDSCLESEKLIDLVADKSFAIS